MGNDFEMLIEFLVELISVAAIIIGVALGIQKHYMYFLKLIILCPYLGCSIFTIF